MVDDGERDGGLPRGRGPRDRGHPRCLNEAMASLKTSMTDEVKSLFKEFLDGIKPTTDPEKVVDPTSSESDVNSGKEGASSLRPILLKERMGRASMPRLPLPRPMVDRFPHLI